MSTIKGIDISHHNSPFPWKNLSADAKFVFCKGTEGATYKDDQFNAYWQYLKTTQLKRGAYHFLRPKVDVQKQVDNFLGLGIDFSKVNVLPPVLDIEEQQDSKGNPDKAMNDYMRKNPNATIDQINQWFEKIHLATGRVPMLYSNKSFFSEYLDNHSWPNNGLWLAAYQSKEPGLPKGYSAYTFWQNSQYGSLGLVPGKTAKDGSLDLNIFNGDMAALNKISNNK